MNLFKDDVVSEYQKWKKVNPNNFSWWNFINMKADLDTALAFAKFYCPEIIEIEEIIIDEPLEPKELVDLDFSKHKSAQNWRLEQEKEKKKKDKKEAEEARRIEEEEKRLMREELEKLKAAANEPDDREVVSFETGDKDQK